jgi:ribonuclease E
VEPEPELERVEAAAEPPAQLEPVFATAEPEPEAAPRAPDPNEIVAPPEAPRRGWWRRNG